MLSVPRVTMNAGSRRPVTRLPLTTPKPTHARIPSPIASRGSTPLATASFVITIWPKAITVPHERSIPAVRMTNVCPIASTPTTITCWSTSERFWPWRKLSDLTVKKAMASSSATNGPIVGVASTRPGTRTAASRAVTTRSIRQSRTRPGRQRRPGLGERGVGLAPAVLEAVGDTLGRDAGPPLERDQVHAGVVVTRNLPAGPGVADDCRHASRSHAQRVLLRGRVDDSGSHVPDTRAAAVDGDDRRRGFRLPSVLERVPGALGARLVDRVDDVDVGALLETVLHRRLRRCRLPLAVAYTGDLRIAVLDPEALQKTVVAELADRGAGVLVEHADRDGPPARRRPRVLADQDARIEVVRRVERIDHVGRARRRVKGDDEHARLPRLPDRCVLGLRIGDSDQDPLDARGRHVLDRRDLARVVGAVLAGGVHELGAELLRLRSRALPHLDEEGVRDVLGDQPDLDLRRLGRGCLRARDRRQNGGDGDNENERENQRPSSGAGRSRLPSVAHATLPMLIPYPGVVAITQFTRLSQAVSR